LGNSCSKTAQSRIERREAVNELVSSWVRRLPLNEVLERCRHAEVPCAKLLSISEIFQDPHYLARENLIHLDASRAGPLTIPVPVPKLSKTPPRLRHVGPALGENTAEVFGELLGLSTDSIAELKARQVI
jgi:crotonobetainyl-CoA:carnitine CoA-transferase CaiB-like acyl-CoA transferase